MCEDMAVRDKFFERIDSDPDAQCLDPNLADGGEFGMGAEIGIATGKMPGGPVAAAQLTRLNIWSRETELPALKVKGCECFAVVEFHREPIGTLQYWVTDGIASAGQGVLYSR